MKKYLCIEEDEQFIIEAKNIKEAQKEVSLYGGFVVKELKEELKTK